VTPPGGAIIDRVDVTASEGR